MKEVPYIGKNHASFPLTGFDLKEDLNSWKIYSSQRIIIEVVTPYFSKKNK